MCGMSHQNWKNHKDYTLDNLHAHVAYVKRR